MTSDSMNIIQALLAVSQSGPDEFRSNHAPRTAGNPPPIAYGGCTVGVAVLSAYETVLNSKFHLYSVLGSFHGFARNDRPLFCRVTSTRDTRTFATRRALVYQKQDDGQDRICAEILVDFHVPEEEFTRYSARPSQDYGKGPEDRDATGTGMEVAKTMVQEGQMPDSTPHLYSKLFELSEDFFESRSCLAGVSGQSLHGMAKHLKTSQDSLAITEKASAEWARLRQSLDCEAENAAALAFLMDGALTALPLVHNHQNLFDPDLAACSTLDFALRVMVPGFQMHKWHLRERKTIAAAMGRTYSEARLWDEEGTLIAVETQSCILRPKKQKPKARM